MKAKYLLSLWLLLSMAAGSLPGFGQVRIKATQNNTTGAQIFRIETVPGSGVFDKVIDQLPSDATYGRIGGRTLLPYVPEPKGQNNITQFGTGKYYSPNFMLANSNLQYYSPTVLKSVGVNGFAHWDVSQANENQVQTGEKFLYSTQNFLGNLGGGNLLLTDLDDFARQAQYIVPRIGYGDYAKYNCWVMDIEGPIFLNPGNSQDGVYSGFSDVGYFDANGAGNGNWNTFKNRTLVMYRDGTTKTVEQMAQAGSAYWYAELDVRRATHLSILLEISKHYSKPGTYFSLGHSLYQGEPRVDFASSTNVFLDGSCDVTHFPTSRGGNTNGTFTAQLSDGPLAIPLTGTMYSHETRTWGYWYRFNFDMTLQDQQEIFDQKKAGTQNYQYLWSKMYTTHVVADEKGYLQLNRRLQQIRVGHTSPIVRMIEARYESGYLAGINRAVRLPFAEVQNQPRYDNPNFLDTPPVWLPPYMTYSAFAVTRFFAGDEPGWGFYVFPEEFTENNKDKTTIGWWNFLLHPMTAIVQARNDLQPYEKFFPGSTLIEDPEVQVGGTGSFTSYDAVAARNNNGGVQGEQRPAYLMRLKNVAGGTWVVILGGMNQAYTAERTDIVRLSASGLNGNKFKVKLVGPYAQIYQFFVKTGESNQTYEALPVRQSNWEMPAYAGRVGASSTNPVVTPPVVIPTNPGSGSATQGLYPDGFDFQSYPATDQSADGYWPTFQTDKLKMIAGVQQQSGPTTGKGASADPLRIYDLAHEPGTTWLAYPFTKNDNAGGQLDNDSDYTIPNGNFRVRGGYGMGASLYMNPKPYYGFSELGISGPGPGYNGLGYNPLNQDDGGNSAKMLHYGRKSTSWNYRWTPLLYSNYLAYAYPTTFEYWQLLNSNVWTTYLKIVNNRTGAAGPGGQDAAYHPVMDHISDQPQELPGIYTNTFGGRDKIVWYDGNAPYTGDGSLRTVNVSGHLAMRQNQHYATEGWIAIMATNGNAMGLLTREPKFTIGYFGSGNVDADLLKPNMLTTYVNNSLNLLLDNQGTYYVRYKTVFGTIAEIRAEAAKSENRPPATPQFKFNIPSRQGWSYGTWGDGPTLGSGLEKRVWDDGVYAIGTAGVWNLHLGRSQYSILESPAVAWKASDNPHIYFRYKYSGSRTTWSMDWVRNKQRPGSAASASWEQAEEGQRFDEAVNDAAQRQEFSVINDGQWHVADINLSGNSEWRNYIQKFYIRPHFSGYTSGTEELSLDWISNTSTGPTQNAVPLALLLLGLRRKKSRYGIREIKPTIKKRQHA